MSSAVITLIILAAVIVMLVTELIPVSVTCLLAMLSMIVTGVLSPSAAFSGFSSTATLLVAGMLVIGEAIHVSGLSKVIEHSLTKVAHLPKKWFVFIVYSISGILSIFINGVAILAFMFPVLDSLALAKDNSIDRKSTYLASAIGTVAGGCCSLVGASSVLNGASIYAASEGGRMLRFFEPGILGFPFLILGGILYATFASRLQDRVFDFDDSLPATEEKTQDLSSPNNRTKAILTGVIFAACVVLWIGNWVNMAAVALGAAAILISFRCVDEKTAYSRMSWSTIVVLGASVGFAHGIDVSGAGKMIADWFFLVFGFLAGSPFGMCVLILVISSVMSNFMSNNSAVVIMAPIAIAVAQRLGVSGVPFILAVVTGANTSLATPICVATVTMTMIAGYRPKDFFLVGGLFNLGAILICSLTLKLVYFM